MELPIRNLSKTYANRRLCAEQLLDPMAVLEVAR